MTDLGPLVKLGDVRQWLKEGDRFRTTTGGCDWQLDRIEGDNFFCHAVDRAEPNGGLAHGGDQLHLISPRWERVNAGDELARGDALLQDGAVRTAPLSGRCLTPTSPLFRLVRTRLATRKDVRVGMRVRLLVTGLGRHVEGLVSDMTEGNICRVGNEWASLLPADADLPVEILAEAPETMTAQEFGEQFATRMSTLVDQMTTKLTAPTGWHPNGVSVTTDPHAALREEFRFIADRVDWELVATVCGLRSWDVTAQDVRSAVDSAFEMALQIGAASTSYTPDGCGMLVIVSPKLELYLEALNRAAYHAKCEELWQEPTEPAIAVPDCVACRRPMGYGRKMAYHGKCGDCFGRWDSGFLNRQHSALEHVGMPEPSTEPSLPLTPSARYHLADDTGWSTPGWEA